MSQKKETKTKIKQSESFDEIDELNRFINKKKNQNEALKKIIDNLNADENKPVKK
jgi:hypothetical protein